MSAFEDFIQGELPRRPFLLTDVPQNTVIVRRGAGPRQLDYVTINQGEVLTVDGSGQLVSASISAVTGIKKFVATINTPALIWTLTHNLASEDVIVQCFDNNKFVILPDVIQVMSANQVKITFGQMQIGTARIIFLS
jgi:hypothetical protein